VLPAPKSSGKPRGPSSTRVRDRHLRGTDVPPPPCRKARRNARLREPMNRWGSRCVGFLIKWGWAVWNWCVQRMRGPHSTAWCRGATEPHIVLHNVQAARSRKPRAPTHAHHPPLRAFGNHAASGDRARAPATIHPREHSVSPQTQRLDVDTFDSGSRSALCIDHAARVDLADTGTGPRASAQGILWFIPGIHSHTPLDRLVSQALRMASFSHTSLYAHSRLSHGVESTP
jgi:hypothetical protein